MLLIARIQAAECRKNVAHGASRGKPGGGNEFSTVGAQDTQKAEELAGAASNREPEIFQYLTQ